jgi:hypothetical protein
MGQVTLLLSAALVVVASSFYKKESVFDPIFTIIPIFIKPYYAPVLLSQIKSYKKLLTSGIGFVILTAASVLLFGVDIYIEYIQIIFAGTGRGAASTISEWSGGVYQPLFVFGDYQNITRVIGLLAVAVFGWILSKKDVYSEKYLFILGISAIMLFAPGVKKYTLVATIPAILVGIWEEYSQNGGLIWIPLLSALLIHSHAYTVKFSLIILRRTEQLQSLTAIIPYIQPALWANILLLTYSIYRLESRHQ